MDYILGLTDERKAYPEKKKTREYLVQQLWTWYVIIVIFTLGKDEVTGSNPVISSTWIRLRL